MKKILIAMVICLTLIALISGSVLAAAQKVPLNKIGNDDGSGFVIFNETSGPNNVQVQMSLKGAMANADYDVIIQIRGSDTYVGTITTNTRGNANFHYSYWEDSGYQRMGLGLKRGGWQFGTGGIFHTFK